MLSAGAVLNDRYRLVEHVATGGMGEVWRATDTVLGRTVAVKVLLPALLAEPGFGTRFAAEARMMAALQHPGIVNVYDYGESDLPGGARAVYLVMEHVQGESLAARLKESGRLDAATSLSIVAQAADALHAAHTAGIVHRDVKPGNLLLRPDGTVTLVDFGVARSVAQTSVTSTNNVVGTALYMAPEQAAGRPVSPATDIYALGALAYHCVAGHPPFSGGTPLDVAIKHLHEDMPPLPPEVPAGVAALVTRALAKEPADRFESAEAMAAAARTAMDNATTAATAVPAGAGVPIAGPDAPTAVAQPASAAPADRPTRRRSWVAALAAGVLLAAAGLAAALAFAPDGISPADRGPGPGPTRSVRPVTPPTTDGAAPGPDSGTTAQPGDGSRSGSPTPSATAGPSASAAAGPSTNPATPTDQPGGPATSAPAASPTASDRSTPEPEASASAPAPAPSGQGGEGAGGTAPADGESTEAAAQPTGSPVL